MFSHGKTLARRQPRRFRNSTITHRNNTNTHKHNETFNTSAERCISVDTVLAAGNVQLWGVFFMMSNHKMIHVSYFGAIVYTTLSMNNKLHISLPPWRRFFSRVRVQIHTESRQTFVSSCAPNSLANILVMWPLQRLAEPRFSVPTLVPGWKIGHRAGWWIWVAFIIYESLWVTSSHLIIGHIEKRTNWTTFEYKLFCTGRSHSILINCSVMIRLLCDISLTVSLNDPVIFTVLY